MKRKKKREIKPVNNKVKNISVIGLGYMGLPMACLLGNVGFRVYGVDINKKRIEMLRRGKLPFEEKGLSSLFKKAKKNISFFTNPISSDVFIISVPTPITSARRVDLSYIRDAVKSIVSVLKDKDLVIIESTVSPGVCAGMVKKILDTSGKKYHLAHCPERAFPGKTIYEMVHNSRVIGGISSNSSKLAKYVYKKFVKGRIFLTDVTTAETVKLLENSYRDINIAFANEMAKISHKIGINVWEAIELANYHPRVDILKPGPGVGGHCIPIDPWFLVNVDRKVATLLKESLLINEGMGAYISRQLINCAKHNKLKIKKIGVFGIAYKKDIDDARETPTFRIVKELKKRKFQVRCTDPYTKKFQYPIFPSGEVLKWSDAIIIVTDHSIYKKMRFSSPNIKLIMDTRNMLTKKQYKELKNTKVFVLGVSKV